MCVCVNCAYVCMYVCMYEMYVFYSEMRVFLFVFPRILYARIRARLQLYILYVCMYVCTVFTVFVIAYVVTSPSCEMCRSLEVISQSPAWRKRSIGLCAQSSSSSKTIPSREEAFSFMHAIHHLIVYMYVKYFCCGMYSYG